MRRSSNVQSASSLLKLISKHTWTSALLFGAVLSRWSAPVAQLTGCAASADSAWLVLFNLNQYVPSALTIVENWS